MLEPYGTHTSKWKLLMTFFDKTGAAPADVHAVVDGATVALPRTGGGGGNAAYSNDNVSPPAANACKHVYFVATRADGAPARWPATGSVGLGNAAGCYDSWLDGGATTSTTTPATTTTTAITTTTTTVADRTPIVSIQSPAAGATVRGMVKISASATDDGAVKAIDVFIDGKRVLHRNQPSLTRQWNTKPNSVKAGVHTIRVDAYDEDTPSHVGTKTITVIVAK